MRSKRNMGWRVGPWTRFCSGACVLRVRARPAAGRAHRRRRAGLRPALAGGRARELSTGSLRKRRTQRRQHDHAGADPHRSGALCGGGFRRALRTDLRFVPENPTSSPFRIATGSYLMNARRSAYRRLCRHTLEVAARARVGPHLGLFEAQLALRLKRRRGHV